MSEKQATTAALSASQQQSAINAIFGDLVAALQQETSTRSEIDAALQTVSAALRPLCLAATALHASSPSPLLSTPRAPSLHALVSSWDLRPLTAALARLAKCTHPGPSPDVPGGSPVPYHKYQGLWADAVQRSITLVLTREFVGRVWAALFDDAPAALADRYAALVSPAGAAALLATPAEVSAQLGVPFSFVYSECISLGVSSDDAAAPSADVKAKEDAAAMADATQFHISVPNYLHATLSLCADLARLSTTSVTTVSQLSTASEGSSDLPRKGDLSPYYLSAVIAAFLKQVQAAFLALDLKNDNLRRHMDTLKYDVKNAEQVVYDLSLRGLI